MVAARSCFLQAGYYKKLKDTICGYIINTPFENTEFFDCGCGDGYYTASVFESAVNEGINIRGTGIDISKFALKKAAKRNSTIEYAVASAYELPVRSESVDVALNVFSPLCTGELARIIKAGGIFIYVVPSKRHLWQMKEILYDAPYENELKRAEYEGFIYRDMIQIEDKVTLRSNEHIKALYCMTPYAYNTSKDAEKRLEGLHNLNLDIEFDIHIYEKS